MKTVLFYFSGTGNTLAAARGLAALLGDTSLISITSLLKESKALNVGASPPDAGGAARISWNPGPGAFERFDLSEYDRVGFVFPVYYLDLPELVKAFVQSLSVAGGHRCFAVATFGERQGSALYRLDRLLREKGARLEAGFELKMPGNSIAFPTAEVERGRLLETMDARLAAIAEQLHGEGEVRRCILHNRLHFAVSRGIRRFFRSRRGIAGRTVSDDCIGCGRCEKLCPAAAVVLNEGKVRFGGACYECFACIHWCPAGSIRFGTLHSEDMKAYTHPDISWRDLTTPGPRQAETA